MREPLISIIVAIYNVEKYIAQCIESIINQTYHNIQIILVDDGSTDQSGTICNKYTITDQRIEVIHQQNKGLVGARKSGLQVARGEYIGFVDGDDYIASNMYEKLLEEIVRSGADFVHSSFFRNLKEEKLFVSRVIEFSNKKEKEEFLGEAVFGRPSYIAPSIWSKLFRADLIKGSYQEVPDDIPYGEDLLNIFICIMKCKRIALLEDAYYFYRVREESMTHKPKTEYMDFIYALRLYDGLQKQLLNYKCHAKFKALVDSYGHRMFMGKLIRFFYNDFQLARYYYAHVDDLQGKKIVIYGAGIVGKDYYAQISRFTDCEIIAWVDEHPEKYKYPHIKLQNPSILDKLDFDILIIAVKNEVVAKEICTQLMQRGIAQDKLFWSIPNMYDNVALNYSDKK